MWHSWLLELCDMAYLSKFTEITPCCSVLIAKCGKWLHLAKLVCPTPPKKLMLVEFIAGHYNPYVGLLHEKNYCHLDCRQTFEG